MHNKSSLNEYGIKRETHYQPHQSGPGGTEKDKQMAGRHSWKRLHNSFKMVYHTAQPGLETLVKIAECLDVDARELIVPTKNRSLDYRYARTYDSLKWR